MFIIVTVRGDTFVEQDEDFFVELSNASIAVSTAYMASFGTAAGLVALHEARASGLEVPQKLIDGGSDVYWDYTGTGWINYLSNDEPITDAQARLACFDNTVGTLATAGCADTVVWTSMDRALIQFCLL